MVDGEDVARLRGDTVVVERFATSLCTRTLMHGAGLFKDGVAIQVFEHIVLVATVKTMKASEGIEVRSLMMRPLSNSHFLF